MKKRYSIPKEQCTCGISELYDNDAKIIGISDVSKAVYDCRKLSITKKVLDCLYNFYHSENQSDETITTCMLLYGPVSYTHLDVYKRQALNLYLMMCVRNAPHSMLRKTKPLRKNGILFARNYLEWIRKNFIM